MFTLVTIMLLALILIAILAPGRLAGEKGKPAAAGLLVGGLLGAVLRPLVALAALETPLQAALIDPRPLVMLLPTAAFGFIAGATGGWLAHPVSGALAGAAISGLFAELILLPCLSLIAIVLPADDSTNLANRLIATVIGMTVAGLVAGGVGGAISQQTNPGSNTANTDHLKQRPQQSDSPNDTSWPSL
jgi:hypothetical protein